ncbi:MAG TPA: hypothetical protein VL096_19390 [Pirellulaceae bacterium]|nr:hypothetical protein [Pirellulaceae bacterium]
MWSHFLVAGLLAVVALGTWLWQQAAWKQQQATDMPRGEFDFYRARQRRRLQISGLLGVIAVAMAIGLWPMNPLVLGFFWCGVLVLLLWVMLLAFFDAAASHAHFDRLHARQLAEQVALQRELAARQRERDGEQSTDTA